MQVKQTRTVTPDKFYDGLECLKCLKTNPLYVILEQNEIFITWSSDFGVDKVHIFAKKGSDISSKNQDIL